MKFSINSLRSLNKHYGCAEDVAPHGAEALARKIGAQLGEIEEVTDVGAKYDGALVVKVAACAKHENSDHLHVCKIDDGHKAESVERDEHGLVQVVCGAPNVREGLAVVWLPPGSIVPESYGKAEPFKLEARQLRGVISNGMLASARELALGDSHEGILEITDDIAPGTPFAEAYNLAGDSIIDIENKMFTHRPDCFGFLGLDRELAGIQHLPFQSPAWYVPQPELPQPEASELQLVVRNELPELVPRFTAVAMRGVRVGSSPLWLQVELAKVCLRPINNIVDYTNYFMLLTGQPLHAYDYDKVLAQDEGADHATLVIRQPRPGEKLRLLNGKELEPRREAIMIATESKLLGVGGVMGGSDTEVSESTQNIIFECGTFDMYSIRRTSMTHGLFTDAVTRFSKGQSPLQNLAVLAKIVDAIRQGAGGKVAGPIVDINHLPPDAQERRSLYPAVAVSRQFVNERLGLDLSAVAMAQLLTNVEFGVDVMGDELRVTAPFWRTDIELREDVVEEIGRLYGYDRLPLQLPQRAIMPAQKDMLLELKSKIRAVLAAAGANEVLTYSFVHGNLLDKAGQARGQAFQVSNALSPDLQYYRLSLTPSLLEKVHANIKAGYDEFALFELGKAHTVSEHDADGTPREVNALAFVCTASPKAAQNHAGAPYYQARKYLTHLLADLRSARSLTFEPLAGADLYNNPWLEQMAAPYEPNRSAVLRDQKGVVWGVVGEYKNAVRKSLKLPDYSAGFELDPTLGLGVQAGSSYVQLPRFPKVEQDICLRVPAGTTYQQVADFVWQKLAELQPAHTLPTLRPLDIYQRQGDAGHKQVTLRLSLASHERTLTDDETAQLLNRIAEAAAAALRAERV